MAAIAAAAALLTLPAAAFAEEYFVPEGNAAVTQYSQSIPTAGGEKGSGDSGQQQHAPAPHKTIGRENVERLEAQGPEGAAAAEVAAQTAPAPVVETKATSRPTHKHGHPKHAKSGGAHHQGSQPPAPPSEAATAHSTPASSGFSEVTAKAFGVAVPGGLGVLLPLILIAALAWACAFLVRGRRQTATRQ